MNLAEVITDRPKLLPGEKRGKALSLVEVSSPQPTVAVCTEFCWFEDCVCGGLKKKKERRHRCFSSRHIQLNQQNTSLFSGLQQGHYRAAASGLTTSPGSAEGLIASERGPGYVCVVHGNPFCRAVSSWNSPWVLKAGHDVVRAYFSTLLGWPTSSLTVLSGNSLRLRLCNSSSLYLIEYQARKIKIKPTNLRPAAKPK